MPMRSTNTSMTIAEYCEQLHNKVIIVNHDYQRTDKVWPISAKSNLIDTILNGFPIPKLILSQSTDLDTLRTRKEVVDGQQRTTAIFEFFRDEFSLTRGDFAGNTFSTLPEDAKRDFIEYQLSIDLFTSANDEDIREVFRRINSYQVPLNKQETRHATHQGEFKWFIRDKGRQYSTSFVKMGAMKERQISRMGDLEFLTELIDCLHRGIKTANPTALNKLFDDYDKTFEKRAEYEGQLDYALGTIINLNSIHNTKLASRGNLYSLFAALVAAQYPASKPAEALDSDSAAIPIDWTALPSNLARLSEALEDQEETEFPDFEAAARQGTNTETNRKTRMRWMHKALTNTL